MMKVANTIDFVQVFTFKGFLIIITRITKPNSGLKTIIFIGLNEILIRVKKINA